MNIMDILEPELVWIEGRCYRINEAATETDVRPLEEHDLYEDEVSYKDVEDSEEEDDDFEVVMVGERFSTSLHVSKHYFGYIIGKKGSIKMTIERDTRTEIVIPKPGKTGDIVIYGNSASNVKMARRRINIIVMSSRMKQRPTHFLSVPMNDTDIVKNFEIFKKGVLRDCPDRGIEESLFIKPSKLHLTIGVMCLMDNEERVLVSKLLTEAKESIIMPLIENELPIKLRLKGVSYMNDDPTAVDVLYGLVQLEGTSKDLIQNLADALVEQFSTAGFMEREFGRDNIKLHVTLLNSKYKSHSSIEDNEDGSRSKSKRRETFDGSGILEKYANYDFGVMELTQIHLSQMHSIGSDGYYQPTCVISWKN